MNIYANPNSAFPSQTVLVMLKNLLQNMEESWLKLLKVNGGRQGGNGTRFATSYNRFHTFKIIRKR